MRSLSLETMAKREIQDKAIMIYGLSHCVLLNTHARGALAFVYGQRDGMSGLVSSRSPWPAFSRVP
jgi:hypothetical protein